MTPTPDAVKASAPCPRHACGTLRVAHVECTTCGWFGTPKDAGLSAELSALRRGVSVEDARVAYENAFVESNSVDRRLFGWHARAHEAGLKAVLALGETGKGVKP